MKETIIALGTWAWGAGMFGGDTVFGSNTDEKTLKPVFDAAMKAGLNLWDTATAYGMGESERILAHLASTYPREDNMARRFAIIAVLMSLYYAGSAQVDVHCHMIPGSGQYLGDPELEPLMAYLDSRGAVIITHPHKPSAVNDILIAAVPLASYEYLAETTRAILNMVAHVSGARNMGVSDAELRALPALLEEKVGLEEAERLRGALKAVL